METESPGTCRAANLTHKAKIYEETVSHTGRLGLIPKVWSSLLPGLLATSPQAQSRRTLRAAFESSGITELQDQLQGGSSLEDCTVLREREGIPRVGMYHPLAGLKVLGMAALRGIPGACWTSSYWEKGD